MMRKFSNIGLFLCLTLFACVNIVNAQGKPTRNPMFKSFEDFNEMVNSPSDKLLFRLVKSEGPNFIGYVHTEIESNGKALAYTSLGYSQRFGQNAKLSDEQLAKLTQKLIDFTYSQVAKDIAAADKRPYYAFIFQNEGGFVRLNFINDIPRELQEILDFLKVEFEKFEKEDSKKQLLKAIPLGIPLKQ